MCLIYRKSNNVIRYIATAIETDVSYQSNVTKISAKSSLKTILKPQIPITRYLVYFSLKTALFKSMYLSHTS